MNEIVIKESDWSPVTPESSREVRTSMIQLIIETTLLKCAGQLTAASLAEMRKADRQIEYLRDWTPSGPFLDQVYWFKQCYNALINELIFPEFDDIKKYVEASDHLVWFYYPTLEERIELGLFEIQFVPLNNVVTEATKAEVTEIAERFDGLNAYML